MRTRRIYWTSRPRVVVCPSACFASCFAWLAAILALALLIVGTQYLASESGEVVVLRTRDEAGAVHETRLWVVDHDGSPWLRAGNPSGGWFPRLSARPEVVVVRGGETLAFRGGADARGARHHQRSDAARSTAGPTATSASSSRARRRSPCACCPLLRLRSGAVAAGSSRSRERKLVSCASPVRRMGWCGWSAGRPMAVELAIRRLRRPGRALRRDAQGRVDPEIGRLRGGAGSSPGRSSWDTSCTTWCWIRAIGARC